MAKPEGLGRTVILVVCEVLGGALLTVLWSGLSTSTEVRNFGILLLLLGTLAGGVGIVIRLSLPRAREASPPPQEGTLRGPVVSGQIRQEYTRERVWLPGLAEPDGVIRNATFVECLLQGPAVLCGAGGRNDHYDMRLVMGHPNSAFVEMPDGAARPDGVIGTKDCLFRGCTYHQVSLMGTRENVRQMRAAVGLTSGEGSEPPRPSTSSM